MALQKHYYKFISLFIKVVIVIAAFWFIYKRLIQQDQDFFNFPQFTFKNGILLSVVLIGTFFNWAFEAYKWKFLIKKIEQISFLKAFKSVLAGLTISIFIPNRVGEIGGRIFFLDKADHIVAACLSMVGGAIQFLITCVFGFIGLFFLSDIFSFPDISILKGTKVIVITGSVTVIVLTLWFVYSKQEKLNSRLKESIVTLKQFSLTELSWISTLSLSRYIIFSLQFLLLLYIYEVSLPLLKGFAAISATFLLVSAVPTFFITELGVRGSVAVAIIGLLSPNITAIFSASVLLWIVNIAIPGMIGSWFVFQLKFFRK